MPLDDPNVRDAIDGAELPRMSFGDHLDELRSRLVKAVLAVLVAVLALLPFKGPVQELILSPYRVLWREGFVEHVRTLEEREAAAKASGVPLDRFTERFLTTCRRDGDVILAGEHPFPQVIPGDTGYPLPYTLYATNGLEDMLTFMWASLVFALVLASPVVIWQAWAFVAAGLYPHERKVFYRYFPFMLLLMSGGVLFGYRIALPYSLGFLVRMMDPSQVSAIFSVGQFLTLEFALTAAMGLVFQLPLVMVALQRIGLVTHATFRRNWRMIILLIFVLAAVVTPPDPASMLLMSTPMVLLYGLGLVLTWWARGRDPVEAAA